MNLQQQLSKANNIFIKARNSYKTVIENCEQTMLTSQRLIESEEKKIHEAGSILTVAANSVIVINKIIGDEQ